LGRTVLPNADAMGHLLGIILPQMAETGRLMTVQLALESD
jgi:hypothetical protein